MTSPDGGFPDYSPSERRADALIHIVGVTAGLLGAAWMSIEIIEADGLPARTAWSLATYGLGLIGMLVMSASYNMARPGPRKALLRRLDHAMIFVMIAGTYTPFTLSGLEGRPEGLLLCAAVWSVAAVGVLLKLFFLHRFERLGLVLYLGLGWAVVTVAGPLSTRLSGTALWLLAIGGVLYTFGVIFHLLQRMPYHNAVWHFMVLAAAVCHFSAVMVEFVP
ncbi:PAQR family membrane homeostasis protein TrhA [Azospirillum thermophilum]|uniref:DNA-binding protein n=1 Tax=Azospirillum thermophilum TaxID=2202148 RepID=A0A2S2CLJ9_9PROT|nr:hemolysin III family protein [Azospirillum thermophilum]AWK85383.1 DNA-binding protein [Azospirillum thermophilum]